MRYGIMTVIRRADDYVSPSGAKIVQWLCRCDCGVEKVILSSNLSKIYSCGCQAHKNTRLIDLTGNKYCMLKVIGRAPNQILPSGQQQTMWYCKCDCGAIITARGSHLKNGFTQSCGCMKSAGERKICELLAFNKINFIREYTYADCINSNGNQVRFDFAIIDENKSVKFLIEYQGEQHYLVSTNNFGKMQREETDQLKKEYCRQKNILLFEIKYSDAIEEKIYEILKNNT